MTECGYTMKIIIWPKMQIAITYEKMLYIKSIDNVYITPEIKGITNNNRSAYKILEVDTTGSTVRFAADSPFWSILKKKRYYQYCKTFGKFVNWLKSTKQKIQPNSSFVDVLYHNSFIYDNKFTKEEKEYTKLLLEEFDRLCDHFFIIQNTLNQQVNQIYKMLQSKTMYYDNDIKRKISMKKSMNKYFRINIIKHGIIYHTLHLTYFAKLKYAFNIIPITNFRNLMNSHQYIEYILKCLDVHFEDIRGISQIVMEYCEIYFLLPLEKSIDYNFRKHLSFSRRAGVFIINASSEGHNGKDRLFSRFKCINNQCIACYLRKKNQANRFYDRNKENDILLESFNTGIAYNVNENRYYVCD